MHMKRIFKRGLFGYKIKEVEQYINDMRKDYEDNLSRQRDRILDLNEENRSLKQSLETARLETEKIKENEKFICNALVKAEQKAEAIIEETKLKTMQEIEKIELEKKKYKKRFERARQELIDFEKSILIIMDKFQSEINLLEGQKLMEELDKKEMEEVKKISAL